MHIRSLPPAGADAVPDSAGLNLFRADPDLQALHARVPAVTVWDDHEIANDAWRAGAENHGRDEGEWAARVAAAKAAYRDWMPVSDALWASYDIGRLATLYRLETRVSGRDEPLDLAAAIRKGPDEHRAPAPALASPNGYAPIPAE